MKKLTLIITAGIGLIGILLVLFGTAFNSAGAQSGPDPCGGYYLCTNDGYICVKGGKKCRVDCIGPGTPGTGLSGD